MPPVRTVVVQAYAVPDGRGGLEAVCVQLAVLAVELLLRVDGHVSREPLLVCGGEIKSLSQARCEWPRSSVDQVCACPWPAECDEFRLAEVADDLAGRAQDKERLALLTESG